MRIQYSLSIFLSVLITVCACQRGAHRMYMDDSDHRAADQSYKEHDASAMSLQVITDTLPVVHPKEASVETSSATPSPSSSGDGGSPMSVQMLLVQGSEAPEGAKPMEGISKASTDEQVAPDYSSEDHENWFHEFVNVVDNAEAWSNIKKVLDRGKLLGYLTQSIAWDDDEYTPLHYAAEGGKWKVVEELVERLGVPVDIVTGDSQRTPLHLAAQEGHLEVVKFLIEQCEAQWNKPDKEGANTLHYAASGIEGDANVAVVKYLVEIKNADPSIKVEEFNLLYIAIKVNNPELARYLVTQYPVLTTDMYEKSTSPLEFARATGRRTIVGIIEEAVKNVSYF